MSSDGAHRALALLGLGIRARNATVGVEQVRAAARKRMLRLALVAADASEHSRAKVVPLLAAGGVRVIDHFTAAQLGRAVGRDQAAAIGVLDGPLATGILRAVALSGRTA